MSTDVQKYRIQEILFSLFLYHTHLSVNLLVQQFCYFLSNKNFKMIQE